MNVTKVKTLIAESEKKYDKAMALTAKAGDLRKKAQKLCEHPATIEEESYFEGTYYDKASTKTYITCAICGKLIDTKIETHSYYG